MALYHSETGSNVYTIIGTVDITNGIATVGSNGYLRFTSFPLSSSDWEIVINATTTATTLQRVFARGGFLLLIKETTLRWCLNNASQNYDIGDETCTITNYPFAKMVKQGSYVSVYLSADGVSYTKQTTGIPFGQSGDGNCAFGSSTNSLQGTINLNKSYIKVDGQPYFGICPVTVKNILIGATGKNLFNKDDSTNWGGWYPSGGVIAESIQANKTVVMRCSPNTTYYFKHCTYTGGLRAFYTEEENWTIGSSCSNASGATSAVANSVYTITTSANAKWLFLCFGRSDTTTTATFEQQASDYMLSTEELTSETPYESYQLKPDYVIRNDKLVWVKPNMYLTGPVNYTVVGSPTVEDGVASGFGNNSYFSLGNTFTMNANTVADFVLKIKLNGTRLGSSVIGIAGTPNMYGLHWVISSSSKLVIYLGDNSSWSIISNKPGTTVLSANVDYYAKLSINKTTVSMYLSTDGINYTQEMSEEITIPAEYTYNLAIGRSRTTDQYFEGDIDLKPSYITYNGQLWFYGKNYATQNIAPVPSGYTYGTTTTSAIGWVDMRTQQFTAAPTGATIGRDS